MHFATQQPSFLLNIDYLLQMNFELHQQLLKLELVSEFIEQMKSTLEEAKITLQKS